MDQNADDTGEKVAYDRQQTADETAHVLFDLFLFGDWWCPQGRASRALAWSPARRGIAHCNCEPLILPWRDSTVTPIQ